MAPFNFCPLGEVGKMSALEENLKRQVVRGDLSTLEDANEMLANLKINAEVPPGCRSSTLITWLIILKLIERIEALETAAHTHRVDL